MKIFIKFRLYASASGAHGHPRRKFSKFENFENFVVARLKFLKNLKAKFPSEIWPK